MMELIVCLFLVDILTSHSRVARLKSPAEGMEGVSRRHCIAERDNGPYSQRRSGIQVPYEPRDASLDAPLHLQGEALKVQGASSGSRDDDQSAALRSGLQTSVSSRPASYML